VAPVVLMLVAGGAAVHGAVEVAIVAGVLGWGTFRLARAIVIEVSRTALTRGLVARGVFRGRSTVIPWSAVAEVHTAWRRPGDDSALETTVRAFDGRTVRLSTRMGLAAYLACLSEVARRAPAAVHSGETDAVLADGPPTRQHVLAALRTAAVLALLLVALVGLHYVWAQGRSSLARYLEQTGAGQTRP
jgi:hypothetical protein